MIRNLFSSFSLTLALVSPSAFASIVSGAVTGGDALTQGGVFSKLTVPFIDSAPDSTVGSNNLQEANLYGLDEDQNVTLTAALSVNILADGIGGGGGVGDILLGTYISSQYIFFDPFTTITQKGTVSFDGDILGVITSKPKLNASDFLQADGVNYLDPTLRGLEASDTISITGLNTISVDWKAGTPGDYIRVITEATAVVPVPAAAWLFGTGLLTLLGVASKSRRKT